MFNDGAYLLNAKGASAGRHPLFIPFDPLQNALHVKLAEPGIRSNYTLESLRKVTPVLTEKKILSIYHAKVLPQILIEVDVFVFLAFIGLDGVNKQGYCSLVM